MFVLGPMPAAIAAETLEIASQIASSTIGHMRDFGFAHGLHALTGANRAIGTAVTVRLPDMDSTMLHYAVDQIRPGDVLVVDMGGDTDRASVGAMVAFAAKQREAAAIVIDGMATDLGDLVEFGIPVFARGISPMTTRLLGIEGALNVPVSIGGAPVVPGMLVIADPDGVLFIDPADFLAVSERAIAAQGIEPGVKESLLAGAALSELSGAANKVLGNAMKLAS